MLCLAFSLASATETTRNFNFVVVCRPVQPALGERFSFDMQCQNGENVTFFQKVMKKRENAILANQNYDIYQSNQDKIKNQQDKLDKLNENVVEAQKSLSEVSKEKQRQLYALNQEIAQKRLESFLGNWKKSYREFERYQRNG